MADLDKIKSTVLPVLKTAGVTKSSIFGSYVRGDFNDKSDIDILVQLPEKSSLLDLVRLERKLEEILNKRVDLLTFDSLSPYLKDSILASQYQIL